MCHGYDLSFQPVLKIHQTARRHAVMKPTMAKTLTVNTLASCLFDDERNMIRIDMSELAEKHAVSRLIGAPPGYVGYEDGGQLTESVRRRPYSVVLLDEIEKAHPEVFNLLLQLLDEGRLTDSHGREVSFRNTIVIMTSNIGSDIVARRLSSLTSENRTDLLASLRTELLGLLRKSLRPEFLNRIDDVILFEPLLPEEIREIIDIQLQRVVVDAARQGITLGIDPEAADWLARLGYDPLQGARPLRRVIQRHVINPLSRAILAGEFSDASTALLGVDDRGKISFRTSESGQSDGPQQ